MSALARIKEDAQRVDSLIAEGALTRAAVALDVMACAIKSFGVAGLGPTDHIKCCEAWLERVRRLALARNADRWLRPTPEPWAQWFAAAQKRVREERLTRGLRLALRCLEQ